MSAAHRLFVHVLETAPTLALRPRAQLYRDTAEVLADRHHGGHLLKLADECEAIERKHQQLVLDFKRRAS